MHRLLSYAVAAALAILAITAGAATNTPARKTAKKSAAGAHRTTPAHKTTSSKRKGTSAAHKSSTATTARRSTTIARKGTTRKGAAKRTTSWRNRQMQPSPERYKEIQQALVAKGYLKPEDAQGAWNQTSIDAMKKFQADQKLDSTGKINSLSLIALGLGPKHDSASAKSVETPQEQAAK